MVMDSGGNMVPKGSKTDPEVVAQRAAAAARRAAKAAPAPPPVAAPAAAPPDGLRLLAAPITIGTVDSPVDEEGGDAGGAEEEDGSGATGGKAKKERGLTRKQKKQLEREQKDAEEAAEEAASRADPLSQFMLSFAGAMDGGDGDGHSSNDVVVEGFSISAPGSRSLLTDATLKLFKGRRYGLLGNNGSGKSTLLRFIAAKPCKLPMPASLDVLLVEQEISASDTSVRVFRYMHCIMFSFAPACAYL